MINNKDISVQNSALNALATKKAEASSKVKKVDKEEFLSSLKKYDKPNVDTRNPSKDKYSTSAMNDTKKPNLKTESNTNSRQENLTSDKNIATTDKTGISAKNDKFKDSKNTESPISKLVSETENPEEITQQAETLGVSPGKTKAPMLDFLKEMKNTLGVEPDQILQAMEQLSQRSLMASPNESSLEFIANLGLPEEESVIAAELYENMLEELSVLEEDNKNFLWINPVIQNESIKNTVIQTNTAAADSAAQSQLTSASKLQRGLDEMNKKFFNVNQEPKAALNSSELGMQQAQAPVLQTIDPKSMNANGNEQAQQNNNSENKALAANPAESAANSSDSSNGSKIALAGLGMSAVAAADMQKITEAIANAQSSDLASNSLTEASSAETKSLDALLNKNESTNALNAKTNTDSSFKDFMNQQSSDQGQQMMGKQENAKLNELNLNKAKTDAGGFEKELSSSNRAESSSSIPSLGADSTTIAGLGIGAGLASTASAASDILSGAEMPMANSDNKAASGEEIVKNAQLLVKKGGGEMKMQLNDGGADLQLKVVVNEGKVDVQLMTDSSQMKKQLESDLGQLKASMLDQKLDLQSIKIETSQDASRQQLDQQMADQQREQARNFLKDFREQNFEERGQFAGTKRDGKTVDEIKTEVVQAKPSFRNNSKVNIVV